MSLIILTIFYCILTHLFNIDYLLALGLYFIVLSFIKGYFSKELKDIFNFKKTKDLYKVNGFNNSITELFSLMLVFINSYLIDYDPFSIFEFVYMFFLILLGYRFIFWGITRTIRANLVR